MMPSMMRHPKRCQRITALLDAHAALRTRYPEAGLDPVYEVASLSREDDCHQTGHSLLSFAAECNDSEMIGMLLAHGASIDDWADHCRAALALVSWEDLSCMRLLLTRGVSS